MKYGLLFLLAAGLLSVWAYYVHPIFTWPAMSFAWVASGYLIPSLGAKVYGKSNSARALWWRLPLAGPVIVFMMILRRMLLVVRRAEPDWNEVSPGIYVGRRIAQSALPADVVMVVDLTSEFLPVGEVPPEDAYVCLPTLDGHIPTLVSFRSFIAREHTWNSPLYVHCAAGHGRSAMVAAALMVRRGKAASVQHAVKLMQKHRPGIYLNRTQQVFLEHALSEI